MSAFSWGYRGVTGPSSGDAMRAGDRVGWVPMAVGGRHAFWVIAWLPMVFQASACASDLVFEDGRYWSDRGRYSIAKPGGEGSAWRRVRVEGAEIAFRAPDGATLSLIEHCGRPLAKPSILARQLLIGLEGRTLIDEGPLPSDESRGWVQWLEATAEGNALRLTTVTRVIGTCSYDGLLVVPDGLERHEPVFEAWWGSFRIATPEPARGEDG